MRKFYIIAASVLLTACSSGEFVTDVSSKSYKEDYNAASMSEIVTAEKTNETDIQQIENNVAAVETMPKKERTMPIETSATRSNNTMIKILPPTAKQETQARRFGYTLQVIAVDSSDKALSIAKQLPKNRPSWVHYKQVNGTNWYAVLYGDFETQSQAKSAMSSLPAEFKSFKPFVKSLDAIKNSDYPKLIKSSD